MINVKIGKSVYSMSFVTEQRTFDAEVPRLCVTCDIYQVVDGQMMFLNKGISICHPLDKFNAKIGAKKALQSATSGWFVHSERKAFQDVLEGWFSNGKNV